MSPALIALTFSPPPPPDFGRVIPGPRLDPLHQDGPACNVSCSRNGPVPRRGAGLFLAYPAHAQVVSGPGSNRVTGFALHRDNADPSGVTDDADTIWVLNRSFNNAGDKIFAYKRSDGSRDTDQDFNTLNGAGNNTPTGLCSDGTTMWVADHIDDKAYAYRMSHKSHDPSKDITFASNHDHVNGLWCNTHTMWASEDDSDSDPGDKIFAYKLSDGAYDDRPGIATPASPAAY